MEHAFFSGGAHPNRAILPRLIGPLFAAIAALVFLFLFPTWPETPDGWIHLHRTRALAELLQAGFLTPRWLPDFAFGYGHPIFHYYAPASYYPPALLTAAGLDPIKANRWSAAVIFGLSGWAMVAMLHTALGAKSRNRIAVAAALAGATIYLAAPYRIYDFAVRGALPEFAAFLWLPLLGLGVTMILNAPSDPHPVERRRLGAVTFGGSLALLALTHNLSAMMAVIGILLLTPLLLYWSSERGQVALYLGTGLLLGAALSAWYAVPALLESGWVGIGANPPAFGYANHFADWTTLFQPRLRYTYPLAFEPTVALPLLALLILLLGLGALFVTRAGQRARRLIVTGLLLAVASLWLTTASSALLWTLSAPLLGKLQFPWRWQTITTFSLGLVTAGGIQAATSVFTAAGRQIITAWTLTAVMALAALLTTYGNLDYEPVDYAGSDVTREQMWAFDAAFGQVGATWTGEFLPRWVTEERWAIGLAPTSLPASSPDAAVTVTPLRVGPLGASYATDGDATTLRFRRFYFPTWQVEIDGAPAAIYPDGDLALLAVDLPAGRHIVDLAWMATPAVQMGRALGGIGWAATALLFFTALRRRPRRWTALTLWTAVGLIAVTGQLNLTGRTLAPQPVGADFGVIRLEAAWLSPTRAGDSVPVHQTWLVRQSTGELTAFLHLVDEDGTIVAQQDGPLAGPYQPASRWQPGDLVEQTTNLALPPDLPPGAYRLLGGVYPTGSADQPLTVDDGTARVGLGVLEVRP